MVLQLSLDLVSLKENKSNEITVIIFYQPGEIVFGDGCSKLCRCAGNYTLACVDNSCAPTEECREVNGVPGCYPQGNLKKKKLLVMKMFESVTHTAKSFHSWDLLINSVPEHYPQGSFFIDLSLTL